MDLIKYAILGLIQGITEPIPVSSSGHLLIFKNLFNTTMFNDLSFEIIANFGSFIAILIIFWPDILILIKHFFKYFFDKKKAKNYYPNFKYVTLLIVSTLPAGIIGLLFKNKIESLISVKLVGISLIITGIALLFVKKMNGNKKAQDLTYTHALLIGFFQMFALLPGLSRSGMVMCGCLLCGLSNSEALKYTFMLYFPVSLGAMLSLNNAFNVGSQINLIAPYILGFAVALIITYFTFNWFKNIVNKGNFWKFSIYCLIMGLLVLAYFR